MVKFSKSEQVRHDQLETKALLGFLKTEQVKYCSAVRGLSDNEISPNEDKSNDDDKRSQTFFPKLIWFAMN